MSDEFLLPQFAEEIRFGLPKIEDDAGNFLGALNGDAGASVVTAQPSSSG
jgi:hypothetical protein